MNVNKLVITIAAVDHASTIFERTGKSVDNLLKKFKDLKKEQGTLAAISGSMGKLGEQALWAGGAFGAALGIPQQIGKLVSSQDSFNQFQILTGKTKEQMEVFKKEIFRISSETGQGNAEILAAATTKWRSGMEEADIFASLRTEGKLATATNSKNLAQISDATYQFSRQMEVSYDKAGQSMAGIFEISKKGRVDLETLIGSAGSLMGEASSMGVVKNKGIQQLVAAVQVAARRDTAEGAAASVQSLFADMKTAKQEKRLQAFGLENLQEEAEASGNYIEYIVKKVKEKTKGNEAELSQIFTSASTRNLIRNLSDDLGDFNEMWESATKATGKEIDEAFKVSANSLSQSWSNFQNKLAETANDSNIVSWSIDKLTGLMGWLSEGTWKAEAAMGAFIALVGGGAVMKFTSTFVTPVISGIWKTGKAAITQISAIKAHGFKFWANSQMPWLSKVSGGFKTLASNATGQINAIKTHGFKFWANTQLPTFSKIAGGLKTATTATWGFVKALIAQAAAWAMTPMGMITIAIAAIVGGAIAIWKNWDKVVQWFKDAWEFWSGLWSKMPNWLQWCFPIIKITTLIIGNWDKVKAFFKNTWEWISGLWSKMPGWLQWCFPIIKIATDVKGSWQSVKDFFANTWAWISGLWQKMPGWLQWCFPIIKITTLIIGNWDKVKGFFKNLPSSIAAAFSRVLNAVTGFFTKFKDAGKNIINAIWDGIKSMVTKPVDAIKGMAEKMRKFLPFSPAKEGPLKDIHRLRFTETIAESIKEAPLTKKLGQTFSKPLKQILPKALTLTAAIASPVTAMAAHIPRPASLIKAIAAPAQNILAATRTSPKQSLQITINIDAKGAAPGVHQNIEAAVMKMLPQLKRALNKDTSRIDHISR